MTQIKRINADKSKIVPLSSVFICFIRVICGKMNFYDLFCIV